MIPTESQTIRTRPRGASYKRDAYAIIAAGIIAISSIPVATGGEVAAPAKETVIEEPATEAFIHGLIDFQVSNYYITPRGLIVEDEGVVFQPLLLLFANFYKGDGWLTSVDVTAGVWNSLHSKPSANTSSTTRNWNEFDAIAGLSVTLFKDITLSATYLLFVSPVDDFEPSQNLELMITYSDHFLEPLTPWGKLSINPYVKVFIEMHNKATVSTTEEGVNVEIGLVPRYVFNGYPLKIEFPSFITLPSNNFYSEPGVPGVISTGIKVTAPLTFIPPRYGNWSLYAGVKYYHIFNDGIAAGNELLPSRSTNRNPVQFLGGVTLTF